MVTPIVKNWPFHYYMSANIISELGTRIKKGFGNLYYKAILGYYQQSAIYNVKKEIPI